MAEWLFQREDYPDLTYSDVFLTPSNPLLHRILDVCNASERKRLVSLEAAADKASGFSAKAKGGRSKSAQSGALDAAQAFRGYVMELAQKYSDVAKDKSRDDVDMTPRDGFGNIPIVVANMNAVVGKRMAEAMARMGGSAAIPQDKTDDEMGEIADYLHGRDVETLTPILVTPDTRIHELEEYMQKRDLDTAIVVDRIGDEAHRGGKFVGIVRFQRDGKEPIRPGIIPLGINADKPIREYVRAEGTVTATKGISHDDAYALMQRERTHFLPILDRRGRVHGVLTEKFLGANWRYKAHEDDVNGGLAMLATIGAVNQHPAERARFLIDLGVKGIVMDTAHLDQGVQTYRNIETVANLIAKRCKHIKLIAGNMVTKDAVRSTIAAGADIAKVGVGPGAVCTTRMETGNGRPQLSAVADCAEEADRYGRFVWADGGIEYPRDAALALAAGASQVMVGSLFTPTVESPGPFKTDERGEYKVNFGMASRRATEMRNLSKSGGEDLRSLFRRQLGHRAEGLSESRMYVQEGRRTVAELVHWIMDGVTSSMTYSGARNLEEFVRFSRIGIQTQSGYREGEAKKAR